MDNNIKSNNSNSANAVDKIIKLDNLVGSTPIMSKLKSAIKDSATCTIIFTLIFLVLLISNGFFDTNFNLDSLLTLYGVIYAKQAINYGIDSSLNSPKNELPSRKEY